MEPFTIKHRLNRKEYALTATRYIFSTQKVLYLVSLAGIFLVGETTHTIIKAPGFWASNITGRLALEWLGGVALTVGFPLQFYFRFLRNIKAKYPDPEFESEYAFYNDRVITISNATRVEIYWQDVVNYLVIGHFLVVSVRNRAEMYFIQLKGLSATQRAIVFSNLKNARPTRPNT